MSVHKHKHLLAILIVVLIIIFLSTSVAEALTQSKCSDKRGTGDLGLVIERASSSVLIVNNSRGEIECRIEGLGNLSHASVVFSRDQRFAYVFARDGGLSKIDLLQGNVVKRIVQSGNSIGGAISQDGKIIAVSNYKPGGVKFFASSDLSLLTEVKTTGSKTVGLVDAPGQKFVFGLFNHNEIRVVDFNVPNRKKPKLISFSNIGKQPYDGLISPDGRYYLAGLFGDDGVAKLDMWDIDAGVNKILPSYGKGSKTLPVYKMPHLEGWAVADNKVFLPAVGRHEVWVIDQKNWQQIKRIKVKGQPVFVMARPDGRYLWVNFALPDNQFIQVIDTLSYEIVKELEPGKGVLHMEFTSRGREVWISVRDKNEIHIYDTESFQLLKVIKADKPSGIFFTHRAHQIGL